jgi:hypothetical protein
VQRALVLGIGSLGLVAVVAMLVMMTMATDVQPESAGGIQESGRVTLVERDADIPAHPGPLDSRVPFRFAGGSSALILSIDTDSGWIQIRGEDLDGEEALARVVDTEVYDLHVSGRGKTRDMNGRQNTGFAYKKGLDVARLPDFDALDVGNGGLRHGARISVAYGDEQLQLMSVHLKSGCFGNTTVQGRDCARLLRQVPVLEEWIDQHAAGPDPLIVLGDFNRRLNDRSDAVWAELDDGRPSNADLTAVTEGQSISCRDNRFPGFVDHIVFGLRSIDFVDHRHSAR